MSDATLVCTDSSKELIESMKYSTPKRYVARQPSVKIAQGTVRQGMYLWNNWQNREDENVINIKKQNHVTNNKTLHQNVNIPFTRNMPLNLHETLVYTVNEKTSTTSDVMNDRPSNSYNVPDAKFEPRKIEAKPTKSLVSTKKQYWDEVIKIQDDNESTFPNDGRFNEVTLTEEKNCNTISVQSNTRERTTALARKCSVMIKPGTVKNLVRTYRTSNVGRSASRHKNKHDRRNKNDKYVPANPVKRTISVVIDRGRVRATRQLYEIETTQKNNFDREDSNEKACQNDSNVLNTQNNYEETDQEIFNPIISEHCLRNGNVSLSDSSSYDGITRGTVVKNVSEYELCFENPEKSPTLSVMSSKSNQKMRLNESIGFTMSEKNRSRNENFRKFTATLYSEEENYTAPQYKTYRKQSLPRCSPSEQITSNDFPNGLPDSPDITPRQPNLDKPGSQLKVDLNKSSLITLCQDRKMLHIPTLISVEHKVDEKVNVIEVTRRCNKYVIHDTVEGDVYVQTEHLKLGDTDKVVPEDEVESPPYSDSSGPSSRIERIMAQVSHSSLTGTISLTELNSNQNIDEISAPVFQNTLADKNKLVDCKLNEPHSCSKNDTVKSGIEQESTLTATNGKRLDHKSSSATDVTGSLTPFPDSSTSKDNAKNCDVTEMEAQNQTRYPEKLWSMNAVSEKSDNLNGCPPIYTKAKNSICSPGVLVNQNIQNAAVDEYNLQSPKLIREFCFAQNNGAGNSLNEGNISENQENITNAENLKSESKIISCNESDDVVSQLKITTNERAATDAQDLYYLNKNESIHERSPQRDIKKSSDLQLHNFHVSRESSKSPEFIFQPKLYSDRISDLYPVKSLNTNIEIVTQSMNFIQPHNNTKENAVTNLPANRCSNVENDDKTTSSLIIPQDKAINSGLVSSPIMSTKVYSKEEEELASDSKPEAHKVKVYGAGLRGGKIGAANKFILDTSETEHGELGVHVLGPHRDSVTNTAIYAMDETADTLQVEYTAVTTGIYVIHLTWDNINIPGSPFMATLVQ